MRRTLSIIVVAAALMNHSLSGAEEKPVIVALVGDSTVTDNAGWGKAFAGRFTDKVHVLNFAAGGRSSKSYYDEKRLAMVFNFKEGDFTHFNEKGAEAMTDLILPELRRVEPALAAYLK